jgi:hypothetical protein
MPTPDSSCETAAAVILYPSPDKYCLSSPVNQNEAPLHFGKEEARNDTQFSTPAAARRRKRSECSDFRRGTGKIARCQHLTAAAKAQLLSFLGSETTGYAGGGAP